MPSHPCRWPTCTVYLPTRGYCPEHAAHAPAERRQAHRVYDQHLRDPEAKKFYDSAAWQAARSKKLDANPLCELCNRFSEHVHHTIPVKQATTAQRLEQRFLVSVCQPCHSRIEAEARAT